jgi:hypothetical protein
MKEIFQEPVVQKRLVNVLSYDIPEGSNTVECCLGETPSYFMLYTKEEAPHPFGEMKAFCSYLNDKNGGAIRPIVSVRKGPVPKGFEDAPGMFYHIAAFYALVKTVTGNPTRAMLKTFREIKNDPDALERYSRYCLHEDGFPAHVLQKYLKDKQDLDDLFAIKRLGPDQYSWLLDELEEQCVQLA